MDQRKMTGRDGAIGGGWKGGMRKGRWRRVEGRMRVGNKKKPEAPGGGW